MFCVNCGGTIRDGSQFCTSCGTRAPGAGAVAAPPSPAPGQAESRMKLTINRREEQKQQLFKTITVYYLDVNLELAPEDVTLMKKHNWHKLPLCEGMFLADRVIDWDIDYILGKPQSFPFRSVNELAHVEKQIVENLKSLKQQLTAVVGFTSGGPQEVKL